MTAETMIKILENSLQRIKDEQWEILPQEYKNNPEETIKRLEQQLRHQRKLKWHRDNK